MILFPEHAIPRTAMSAADSVGQAFEHPLDFRTFASLRRMVAHQQSKPLIKRTDFMKQLTLYLPEVAARIEESDFGVVHLEVGAMKAATREALARSDFAAIRTHLAFAADVFDRADVELYEAIRISYLDALFLGETTAAHIVARGMLSRPMAMVLRQSELRTEKQRTIQE